MKAVAVAAALVTLIAEPAFKPHAIGVPGDRVVLLGSETGGLSANESDVMAATLDAAYAPFRAGWVLVDARTATFKCEPGTKRFLDVGGCSGMLGAGETPEQRLRAVQQEIPEVTSDIASDLIGKTQSAEAVGPLPTSVPHALWSPGLEFPSTFHGNPVFAASLSRPGFDARGRHALIYLATLNWTDGSKSMGQYVFLTQRNGKWSTTGHALVWGHLAG